MLLTLGLTSFRGHRLFRLYLTQDIVVPQSTKGELIRMSRNTYPLHDTSSGIFRISVEYRPRLSAPITRDSNATRRAVLFTTLLSRSV